MRYLMILSAVLLLSGCHTSQRYLQIAQESMSAGMQSRYLQLAQEAEEQQIRDLTAGGQKRCEPYTLGMGSFTFSCA